MRSSSHSHTHLVLWTFRAVDPHTLTHRRSLVPHPSGQPESRVSVSRSLTHLFPHFRAPAPHVYTHRPCTHIPITGRRGRSLTLSHGWRSHRGFHLSLDLLIPHPSFSPFSSTRIACTDPSPTDLSLSVTIHEGSHLSRSLTHLFAHFRAPAPHAQTHHQLIFHSQSRSKNTRIEPTNPTKNTRIEPPDTHRFSIFSSLSQVGNSPTRLA